MIPAWLNRVACIVSIPTVLVAARRHPAPLTDGPRLAAMFVMAVWALDHASRGNAGWAWLAVFEAAILGALLANRPQDPEATLKLWCPSCHLDLVEHGAFMGAVDGSGYWIYRCGCGAVTRWNADTPCPYRVTEREA